MNATTLVERLREEADYTYKNWYRVADDETREKCQALTMEAADRIAALEARCRELEARTNQDMVKHIATLEAHAEDVEKSNMQHGKRISELTAALRKHGRHDSECGWNRDLENDDCTCGLSKALASLAKEIRAPRTLFKACYCRFPPGTTECDCSTSETTGKS